MDRNQIEALETSMREEHRRDMEALERLKRFLPNGTSARPPEPPTTTANRTISPNAAPSEDTDNVVVSTLRGKIGEIMASDPSRGWTGQRMFAQLQSIQFPFQAQKPLNSVVVAMGYWVKRGYAFVARKGKGRTPNVFKWKPGRSFPLEAGDSTAIEDNMNRS